MAKYTYSVKQLAAAFPKLELDVDALVKGVPCNNYNSEPCEYGLGRVGLFPWEVPWYGQRNLASASASSRRIATNH